MIQVIPKVQQSIGFASANGETGVATGDASEFLLTPAQVRVPQPVPGVYSDLVIYSRDTRAVTITCELFKNGAGTGLTATLGTGDTVAIGSGGSVSYGVYDTISYKWTLSGSVGFPGYTVGTSVKRTGDGMVFGIPSSAGTPAAINLGYISGPFGNGVSQDYDNTLPANSNSRSICAVDGSLRAIAMLSHSGNVGVGATFTGFVRKNGVSQDGSGGTIDTNTVMLAGTDRILQTFDCPMVLEDLADFAVIRTGVAGNGGGMVAIGVYYEPTVDGQFMLCGGSNDSLAAAPTTTYKWTRSPQGAGGLLALAPTSSLMIVNGLFVVRGPRAEAGSGPGSGQSWTHTLLYGSALVNDPQVPTAAQVVLVNTEGDGRSTGLAGLIPALSTVSLEVVPSAGASSAGFYWGIGLSTDYCPGVLGSPRTDGPIYSPYGQF